jgi:glycosyltransferase involved in cell wall biosynthesis
LGDSAPRVTVLTPTFNRAGTLPRLYESLLAQSCTDFEWLVVDDGSTDTTGQLIETWRKNGPLGIDYLWQENGGKHVALNRGMVRVRTELVAMMDSDDWYRPDALQCLLRRWDEIQIRGGFANIEGRCQLPDGTVLSPSLGVDVLDLDYYEATVQHGLHGDTCGIWRTDVLRAHPFPEDLGPFVSEGLVYNRVAATHRTRYCDDVVGIKEYLSGGLSDRLGSARRLVESSPARLVYLREFLGFHRPMPIGLRVRTHANEIRHALHLGHGPRRQWRETPGRLGWLLTAPLGLTLYLRDRRRLRGEA